MTKQYDYIDIDPQNPPQLPCDARFSDILPFDNEHYGYEGKLIAIIQNNNIHKFIDDEIDSWFYCKLRVEKRREPDDTVERLWFYKLEDGQTRTTNWLVTEKYFSEWLNSSKSATKSYAPGPIAPCPEEWRSIDG